MANIGPDNFELVKELLGDKNTMNRSTLEEVLFESSASAARCLEFL